MVPGSLGAGCVCPLAGAENQAGWAGRPLAGEMASTTPDSAGAGTSAVLLTEQ